MKSEEDEESQEEQEETGDEQPGEGDGQDQQPEEGEGQDESEIESPGDEQAPSSLTGQFVGQASNPVNVGILVLVALIAAGIYTGRIQELVNRVRELR